MQNQYKSLVLSLVMLGMTSLPVYGATDVDVRTQQLQNQVDSLQRQVNALQAKSGTPATVPQALPAPKNNSTMVAPSDPRASGPDAYITAQENPQSLTQFLPIDIDVPGLAFVSSGPYLGVPLIYSGGNLLITTPSINEDVGLLRLRKSIRDHLTLLGRPINPDHGHLLLSGMVEAQASYAAPSNGPVQSGVDLTGTELDGYVLGPSNWTSALFAFAYDNSPGANQGTFDSNTRILNSRLYLSKAFIVLGDFSRTNFYSSFGQMYVPFGTYSSNMVSSPVTRILGRIKTRAVLVGYQQQGANASYASAYVFQGDAHVGSVSRINNFGVNFGTRAAVMDRYTADFGFGLVADIADSGGLQYNGYAQPMFGGFGAPNGFGSEQLSRRVPGLNLRGIFSIGSQIDFLAEYIGAIGSFSATDLTMNSHGARPQAFNTELAYTFNAWEHPSTVAVGFGKTRDALAVGLPADRYSIVFNTSIWKNTIQSLELRHDVNYAANNYASGRGTAVTQVINGAGQTDNMVTAQFDIYF